MPGIQLYRSLMLLIVISILWAQVASAQVREEVTLLKSWFFQKGEVSNALDADWSPKDWEQVQIPHDWAISGPFIEDGDGDTGKLPWKGVGWYRTQLPAATQKKEGKRYFLIFDGVMAMPEIYINGQLAGKWDYGYNSFYVDVTSFLSQELNHLVVKADTRNHDSRWYPGAGIYRKVTLRIVNDVHIPVWGVYVHTPIIKSHYAEVRAKASVSNASQTNREVVVIHHVLHPEGQRLQSDTIRRILPAGKTGDYERTLPISNPLLWSIETPNLYTLHSQVFVDNLLQDEAFTPFGIRSIRFTADDGFYLNDKRVQLKGVNLHHDHGPLGAAFYPRAMERQLELMKAMGVNAVRNSHNVAAPEMLEMCDRMGILVFNEIFDRYDKKANITDTTDFDHFSHRNIRNFVLRDRNHPSVYLWSVGNEIGDVQWNIENGFERLHTMVNYVRKYDAFRPITLVNDNLMAAELRHFDYYDVHSYNYDRRYRLARQMEPNKAVVISESASTLST